MRTHVKKPIAIAIAAVMLMAVGCGEQSAPTETESTTASAAATTTTTAAAVKTEETTAAAEIETAIETEAVTEAVTEAAREPLVLGEDVPMTTLELSVYNAGDRGRLAAKFAKAQNGEALNIAFLGGSITAGSHSANNQSYAQLTNQWFVDAFPEAKINYINAGLGATGSLIGGGRLKTDVLDKQPDVVFVEFSVNDTTENTERNRDSYEGLLRALLSYETQPAVVCIFMTQDGATGYNSFEQYHGEIAKHYNIPAVSYRSVVMDSIENGDFAWTDISDDNIHPTNPGHQLLTELIAYTLDGTLNALNDGSLAANDSLELPAPLTGNHYENCGMQTVKLGWVPDSLGAYTVRDSDFGGMGGIYRSTADADGAYGEPIVFNVYAKSIALLYGRITSKGGMFDVLVDGTVVKTINTDFTGGWGNYVEVAEVYTADTAAEHEVQIVPMNTGVQQAVTITGYIYGE
jgi:lysophospholipase L1-like esterase